MKEEGGGKTFGAVLLKGYISIDEMNKMTKALTLETAIYLNIVGRVRGESITSAQIIGVQHKVKGEKIASK